MLLQQEVLSKMHDGAKADLVYAAAAEFIKNKKPELEKHLTKNIGFAVRMRFHISTSKWDAERAVE